MSLRLLSESFCLGQTVIPPPPTNCLSRALAVWIDRPALALLRALEADLYPVLKGGSGTLDLGCGNGEFAEVLGLRGIVGVDTDQQRLNHARLSASYSMTVRADIQELPFDCGQFDEVICNSTLEHVDDDTKVIAEVSRVLVAGGSLYFTVPALHKEDTLYFGIEQKSVDPLVARVYRGWFTSHWQHKRYRAREQWQEILDNCGFEIMECRPYETVRVGHLGDVLGYIEFRIREVPIIGEHPAPSQLLLSSLYCLLEPYWRSDRIDAELEDATTGGLFLRATKKGSVR